MKQISKLMFVLFMLSAPAWASQYYISPTGNDSNNGTSTGAAWLTPNHAVNCGDVITAAASTAYVNTNFSYANWGTVTCPAGNNVAWLKCATFDGCKINTSGSIYQGMWISKSYWGVEGWEVTTPSSATYGTCFFISPPDSGATEISHIILANNVANGCAYYGFFSSYVGTVSADYIAIIGNIAYNAAQSAAEGCASGISIFEPVPADSVAGTHIYVAGNFSYANVDGNGCQGGTPTDGEGLILDTLGGNGYNQQVAVENNLFFYNGGKGMEAGGGGSTNAPIYFKHNTLYGNNNDPNQNNFDSGEFWISESGDITATGDLIAARSATQAGGSNLLYAMAVVNSQSTNTISGEYAYGLSGQNTVIYSSPGFAFGSNTLGTSPAFANPVNPGAPSCGSSASVAACMAAVIADYTPSASGASAYGRQTVSNTSVTNALFPQWLCTATGVMNSNIPSGLVTPGCGVATASTPTFTPSAGTYTGSQSVTLSTSSPGAVICYNTTGSPATNGSTGCTTGTLYSGAVTVSVSETLYAVAGGAGYTNSPVGSAAYTINAPITAPNSLAGKIAISGKVILQ